MPRYNGGFIGTDGLDAPDPPTDVTPTAGNAQVSVAFTAPTDTGTSAITGFVAQVASSGDDYSAGSNTGSSSPIVVSSLSNGTSYTAKVWAINAYGTSAPSEASSSFSPLAPRIVFIGGNGSSTTSVTMDYINPSSTGNATDFGDLLNNGGSGGARGSMSSTTRGLAHLGQNFGTGNRSDEVQYITMASTGNGTDFGNLTQTCEEFPSAASNATRGLRAGGNASSSAPYVTDTIDYCTIASTGNFSDFGNLTFDGFRDSSGCSSPTRAILTCGGVGEPENNENVASQSNIIQYVTIASTGNATDFGNMREAREYNAASSDTRAVCYGTNGNTIDYFTIASTGNSADFGNMETTKTDSTAGTNNTRGCWGGGANTSNVTINNIEYITVASLGNGTDFGDLTQARYGGLTTPSGGHGGLQ